MRTVGSIPVTAASGEAGFSAVPRLLVEPGLVPLVAEAATLELGDIELPAAFARGRGGVDFLKVHGQDAGVNLGGGKAQVAESS
jgi:hypothetical protein